MNFKYITRYNRGLLVKSELCSHRLNIVPTMLRFLINSLNQGSLYESSTVCIYINTVLHQTKPGNENTLTAKLIIEN